MGNKQDLTCWAPLQNNLIFNVGDDSGLVFTGGANRTYINRSGILTDAAANESRFEAGGFLFEGASTNLFLNSDAPVTQDITTTASDYTIQVWGSGSITLSGTATGVATDGNPVTVTATAGTLTLTVAGSPDRAQTENLDEATSYIRTLGIPVTRAQESLTFPSSGNMPAFDNDYTIAINANPYGVVMSQSIYSVSQGASTASAAIAIGSGSISTATANGFLYSTGPSVAAQNSRYVNVARSPRTTDNNDLYLDGVLGAPATVGAFGGTIHDTITIGCNEMGVNCFYGHITDLRIYSKALSATEVVNELKRGIMKGGIMNHGVMNGGIVASQKN